MERPSNQIKDLFRKINIENRDTLKYIFEKSDNITLWIIGIAIGAISLFANNIGEIQNSIPPEKLKPILLLLTVSITSGIIYRASYLYFFVLANNTLQGMEIAFTNQKIMDTETNLSGDETFTQLLNKVKEGIGDDLSLLLEAYDKVDDSAKEELYKSVVDHYHKSVEFAKNDMEYGLEYVADTYSKFTGKDKDKLLKNIKNPKVNKGYRRTIILTTFLYCVYISTFIVALFLFVFSV